MLLLTEVHSNFIQDLIYNCCFFDKICSYEWIAEHLTKGFYENCQDCKKIIVHQKNKQSNCIIITPNFQRLSSDQNHFNYKITFWKVKWQVAEVHPEYTLRRKKPFQTPISKGGQNKFWFNTTFFKTILGKANDGLNFCEMILTS